MALVLKTLYKGYNWYFEELEDPRLKDLDLLWMSSPIKPIIIITFYFYFIYNLGPRFMANRKPFNLKYAMIIYNAAQILLNCYIVYEAAKEALYYVDWRCGPLNFSTTPRAIYVLRVHHVFFLLKGADLLDTVFFVLRKKQNHVSFLHVYHHFGMFIMLWVAVKCASGGSSIYVGLINAAVHAIMYVYYLLTVIDEEWKKSVTFKRTLTQIQMLQFLFFIIYYGRLMFKPDCAYPKALSYFFVPQNCFMLLLFGDFYRKNYISKKKEPKGVMQN